MGKLTIVLQQHSDNIHHLSFETDRCLCFDLLSVVFLLKYTLAFVLPRGTFLLFQTVFLSFNAILYWKLGKKNVWYIAKHKKTHGGTFREMRHQTRNRKESEGYHTVFGFSHMTLTERKPVAVVGSGSTVKLGSRKTARTNGDTVIPIPSGAVRYASPEIYTVQCPGEDLNLHRITPIRPSSVRVYQFRHLGSPCCTV